MSTPSAKSLAKLITAVEKFHLDMSDALDDFVADVSHLLNDEQRGLRHQTKTAPRPTEETPTHPAASKERGRRGRR